MLSPNPLAKCDFVAVDLETTGCRPGRNSIIEIGAVRFTADRVLGTFDRLVRPDEAIPRAVEELTGITSSMVASADEVGDAVRDFAEFARGAVLVAHNYRFDLSFLDHEIQEAGLPQLQRPIIDTLNLTRRLRPESRRYSLGALATELHTPTTPDHRAGNDARATAEVLQALLPDLQRLGLRSVGDLASFCGLDSQRELAERLTLTRDVPDEPGVYLLRDDAGQVLLVGHAKSLRLRTRQLFYAGAGTDAMARKVASVTTVSTPSQLDAVLIEQRLVDRHRPSYNPAAHRSRSVYLVVVDTNSPYPGLRVVEAPRIRGRLFGPFTSRWAARTLVDSLVDLYRLRRCGRQLRAALALAPCEARDAGTCPAPCVTEPDRAEYAERLERALRVFEDPSETRALLLASQQRAGEAGRYEEAIRHRDGVRALDRAISTLSSVNAAASHDAVFVEEDEGHVTLSFIRGGLRAAVLRGTREAVTAKMEGVIERVYFSGAAPVDVLRATPEKLSELVAIATFATEGTYLEVGVTDAAATVTRLRRALGLERRSPRRHHEATSIG
jgi:DNA polymerase-3 subunit epsilon